MFAMHDGGGCEAWITPEGYIRSTGPQYPWCSPEVPRLIQLRLRVNAL